MPLDVLGCTRATLMRSTSVQPCPIGLGNLLNTHRDGDRLLQLLIFNEEFLVMMDHQFIVITSLPFVHTARRSYRLSNPVNISDRNQVGQLIWSWKVRLTLLLRGRRSRNKVSVGEPAEGSIIRLTHQTLNLPRACPIGWLDLGLLPLLTFFTTSFFVERD